MPSRARLRVATVLAAGLFAAAVLCAQGTDCCEILQVPASAFRTFNFDGGIGYQDHGYLCRQTGGSDLWAPVTLPTGAKLVSMGFFYYDESPTSEIHARLYTFRGGNPAVGGSGTPHGGQLVEVASTAAPGYAYGQTVLDFDLTVKNDVAFDTEAGQFSVIVNLTPGGCVLGFKSVELRWQRQVSPSPAGASFNDVPLDDPAFQFIEALAASGVTAGCGGGNYCPDAPLTRRQMAVFLSKALGLHWPN